MEYGDRLAGLERVIINLITESLLKINLEDFIELGDRSDVIRALYFHIHSLIISMPMTIDVSSEVKSMLILDILDELLFEGYITEEDYDIMSSFRAVTQAIGLRHTQELKIQNILIDYKEKEGKKNDKK